MTLQPTTHDEVRAGQAVRGRRAELETKLLARLRDLDDEDVAALLLLAEVMRCRRMADAR